MSKSAEETRLKRKLSIRKKISGSKERPRLSIFRSTKHIYAQVIDDVLGKTLVSASTIETEMSQKMAGLKKKERAVLIGQEIAKRCLASGIDKVVFDRNGFIYHGRVSSLADGARQGGLQF